MIDLIYKNISKKANHIRITRIEEEEDHRINVASICIYGLTIMHLQCGRNIIMNSYFLRSHVKRCDRMIWNTSY